MEDQRNSASLAELDFWAEQNATVGVYPTRRTNEGLDLASVKIDRFKMYERRDVPLWLGLLLQRKGLATIERPDWLEVDKLRARIAEERKLTLDALTDMPEFFETVAMRLLRPEEEGSVLVQDLLTIRRSKILATIKTIDLRFVHANVKTWTAMERTLFRVGALGLLDTINTLVVDATNATNTQTNTQDTSFLSALNSRLSVSQHSG
jgi:hypothetical protein